MMATSHKSRSAVKRDAVGHRNEMCEWQGRGVSVTVKDTGTAAGDTRTARTTSCYQGTIAAADGASITLIKAFKDGFPCQNQQIYLKACDIEDIEFIDADIETSVEKKHSIVKVTKSAKKAIKPIASENFAPPAGTSQSLPNTLPNGKFRIFDGNQQNQQMTKSNAKNSNNELQFFAQPNNGYGQGTNNSRSKPIDIKGCSSKMNGNGYMGSTPNKKNKQKMKDVACFETPSDDPLLHVEFDFEKNLALFNKEEMWEKLNDKPKQDKVSQKKNKKLKHNENVIEPHPVVYKSIIVPNEHKASQEYVTDDGLTVPSVTSDFRKKLFAACMNVGLDGVDLLGRATAEVALQLLGGSRRLNPKNAHQTPTVVFVIGPHRQGVVGVSCATQLASQGVSVVVLVVGADLSSTLRSQLNLYLMTGNRLTTKLSDLPSSVDLIILALCEDKPVPDNHPQLAKWTSQIRAPVLAIDPPATGTPGIVTKYSIIPILPLAYSSDNGKLYLCNLAIPIGIFKDLGIKYTSPFGSKFVIALHPSDSL